MSGRWACIADIDEVVLARRMQTTASPGLIPPGALNSAVDCGHVVDPSGRTCFSVAGRLLAWQLEAKRPDPIRFSTISLQAP
jgi:hypothetical protein